ncbi:MAG TPA: lysylphosphatidylglycerol synthase domain-containing protein [Candidimonas sp.]|nr:lysylphosphatidylglycerol synthase domain-containing protein [Candidimonas sp.]
MTATSWSRIRHWFASHWHTIRQVLTAAFILLVVVLLGMAAVRVEWGEVVSAIQGLPARALWIAAGLAALSYAVYSTFDVLGKWYTGHGLAWWRCMMVGFISYAFTMSLGAPVGGLGLRLRLYSKQNLQPADIMRILGLSLTTNWVGYLFLAGIVFAMGVVRLPVEWKLDSGPLRVIGVVMVLTGIAYLLLCAFSKTRSWTIRGHEIELPSFGLAAIQVSIAIVNWALIAAVIYVLFQQKVDYLVVLATLLISAIAGALAHIPGGLGVIEAVFVALLAGSMARGEIIGALLVYRAIYYLGPLLIAGGWYLGVEAKMDNPRDNVKAQPR